MTQHSGRFSLNAQVDINNVVLSGEFYGKEFNEGFIAIFDKNLKSHTVDSILVNHEGYSDFQLLFGDLKFEANAFDVRLYATFSPNTLSSFLQKLEKFVKVDIKEKGKPYRYKNSNSKDNSVEYFPMLITYETEYFAPNSYFILVSGNNAVLYLGRIMGEVKQENPKLTSFFKHKISMSITTLIGLIDAIKENIERIEKKMKVPFEQILITISDEGEKVE